MGLYINTSLSASRKYDNPSKLIPNPRINLVPNNAPIMDFCYWPKQPGEGSCLGTPTDGTGLKDGSLRWPSSYLTTQFTRTPDIVERWV